MFWTGRTGVTEAVLSTKHTRFSIQTVLAALLMVGLMVGAANNLAFSQDRIKDVPGESPQPSTSAVAADAGIGDDAETRRLRVLVPPPG